MRLWEMEFDAEPGNSHHPPFAVLLNHMLLTWIKKQIWLRTPDRERQRVHTHKRSIIQGLEVNIVYLRIMFIGKWHYLKDASKRNGTQ